MPSGLAISKQTGMPFWMVRTYICVLKNKTKISKLRVLLVGDDDSRDLVLPEDLSDRTCTVPLAEYINDKR